MGIHKFTVPDEDMIVEKWIAKQSNFGFSIRMMIKFFVQHYGYGDVTCMALGLSPKKRGRPSKQLQEKMDQMFDSTGLEDDVAYGDEFEGYDDTQDSEDEDTTPVQPVAPVAKAPAKNGTPPDKAKPATKAKAPSAGGDDMMAMFSKPPVASGNADGDDDDSELIDSLIG